MWYPGTTRSGISSAVVVDGAVYLVDCGDGALKRFREAGLGAVDHDFAGFENLRAVLLTHLHPDHYADLPGLYLFAPVLGLARGAFSPVKLLGPGPRPILPPVDPRVPEPPVLHPEAPTPGLAELTRTLLAGSASAINESMRDTGRKDPREQIHVEEINLPSELSVEPNINPAPSMKPFAVYEDDRVMVSAILVPHGVTFPSFAYRFDTEHGSIVFSGDTAVSDNVKHLAADADVLVHEVVDEDWARSVFPPPLTPRQEALVAKLIDAHTPARAVGEVAQVAGVETLVLSHLSPANLPAARWRRNVKGYRGRVVVGEDLDQIRLARRRRR